MLKHLKVKLGTNKDIVVLGTDGIAVNMDLWEYTLMDDGSFALNDISSISTSASANASKGYLGTNFEDIVIPQYISVDNGTNWAAVTNIDWIFLVVLD